MSMQELIDLKESYSGFTFGQLILNLLVDEIKVNHDAIDALDAKIDALEARVEALEA